MVLSIAQSHVLSALSALAGVVRRAFRTTPKLAFAPNLLLVVLVLSSCKVESDTSRREVAQLTTAENLNRSLRDFDRDLLTQSLEDIKAWHVENATGLAEELRPGLSVETISQAFSAANTDCVPTDELIALWSWHDGAVSAVPTIWYHGFLPLHEALTELDILLRDEHFYWDPHYIPVFSHDGEWYAAYCGAEPRPAGPIVHFFIEQDPIITHVNLTTLLAATAEAFRNRVVRWEDAAMVENVRELSRIHERFNEGYPFPYALPPQSP